jgi:outer membrane biosynthesis protein TonB
MLNEPTEKKVPLPSCRRRRVAIGRALSLLLLGAALGGGLACTTARAATPVERPNLDVPPAPPRVIEAALPVEAPLPEPVGDVPAPPTGGTSRPKPPRDSSGNTAKPEVKPETPPDPQPVTPIPPAQPPPQLRAPGLASGPETAGEIRGILDRASGMLNNTDYAKLTKTRQASYDTAKRFHSEGEKELKAGNFVLAKELAEKAERLAKELQVR